MKRKSWPLLLLIGILSVGGGVFLFRVTLLELENLEKGKTVRVRISSSEAFSLFYIHSIYREPVTEEFRAEKGAIVLKGVRTKSPAVMEYYGFQDMKEYHSMDYRLGAIYFKRGYGEGQGLLMRGKRICLSEIGERGDRIRLRVITLPLGDYLLKQYLKF